MEENKSYNYEILLEKGKKLLKDYSSKDSSEINILNIIKKWNGVMRYD